MSYSLNEVEVLSKRATRGAGYSWGLAEDASMASRWLCANGLDGVSVLSAVLGHPRDFQGNPLISGTLLADSAGQLAAAPIHFKTVIHPIMILPFAAMISVINRTNIRVKCGDWAAVTNGQYIEIVGEIEAETASVTIEISDKNPVFNIQLTRARPNPTAWEHLTQLAHRTYAPATDESRVLGAGVGLADDD